MLYQKLSNLLQIIYKNKFSSRGFILLENRNYNITTQLACISCPSVSASWRRRRVKTLEYFRLACPEFYRRIAQIRDEIESIKKALNRYNR